MAGDTVNRADRDVVLSMVGQRYGVRVKAIDTAIDKVVDTLQQKSENWNKKLSAEHNKQVSEIRDKIQGSLKNVEEKLRKEFQGKKVKTPAGIDSVVNIDFGSLTAGVSLQTKFTGTDAELDALANAVADTLNAVHGEYNMKNGMSNNSSSILQYIHDKMYYTNEWNKSQYLNNEPLKRQVIRKLVTRYGMDPNKFAKALDQGVSASPSVTLDVSGDVRRTNSASDRMKVIERVGSLFAVRFHNVGKNHAAVKDMKAAVNAALKAIKGLVEERNKLVQEFNDIIVRFSIIRTPEEIMAIAQELGLVAQTADYHALSDYTEKKHMQVLSAANDVLVGSSLKALPLPKDAPSISVDADIIDAEFEENEPEGMQRV